MGLIKKNSGILGAAKSSIGSVLADQWKEYFYCDSLDENVLMTKGKKRVSGHSVNNKGSDNVISKGSIVAIADGQCMIIVDQGKVVEVCAEPGEFIYDSSTEPSVFAGSLGGNIVDSFKLVGKRISFGGEVPKDQRIYYFNTKEIINNKFGTASPIPFRIVINEELGFKLSVDLRCNGTYSYKIIDPLLFYTNVCGNQTEKYTRDKIDEMLKAEVIKVLQPALATLSAKKISYDQIQAHTTELCEAINVQLANDWGRRGIAIFSMNVSVPSIPADQRKKITEWEETAMTVNPNVAAARMVSGQISAMNTAAGNEKGAMNGFIGMGMAMNQGGINASDLYRMGQSNKQSAENISGAFTDISDRWTCSCGQINEALFCMKCGTKREEIKGWTCSNGHVCQGMFCQFCGEKKPPESPLYKCDKCGWEPKDPFSPPPFCPMCGDKFDENDKLK